MEEIILDEYEKDALLNMPDGALEALIEIIKNMTLEMPLYEIDQYSVSERILKEFPED